MVPLRTDADTDSHYDLERADSVEITIKGNVHIDTEAEQLSYLPHLLMFVFVSIFVFEIFIFKSALELTRKMGSGSQGVVYKVRHQNKSYAFKTFCNPKKCAHEANILRKLIDVENVAKMHKELCKKFNAIQPQLIKGKDLTDTKYEYDEVWKQIYPIIQEMAHRGDYHNDVMPKNLIKSGDDIWIIDFRFSHFLDFNDTKALQRSFKVVPTKTLWHTVRNAPQNWLLNKLVKDRYQNNTNNIKADQELIKKLSFEMNAYNAQRKLLRNTLSKQQQNEIKDIEKDERKDMIKQWLWWAEAPKNSTIYCKTHQDHSKEKYLIK